MRLCSPPATEEPAWTRSRRCSEYIFESKGRDPADPDAVYRVMPVEPEALTVEAILDRAFEPAPDDKEREECRTVLLAMDHEEVCMLRQITDGVEVRAISVRRIS